MSRAAWDLIKRSKHFYVDTYRKAGTVLIYSALLNIVLGAAIYYAYINQPERDFYATNGVTPPVMLTPLDEPNYTSSPLLASDPENDDNRRVVPQ